MARRNEDRDYEEFMDWKRGKDRGDRDRDRDRGSGRGSSLRGNGGGQRTNDCYGMQNKGWCMKAKKGDCRFDHYDRDGKWVSKEEAGRRVPQGTEDR